MVAKTGDSYRKPMDTGDDHATPPGHGTKRKPEVPVSSRTRSGAAKIVESPGEGLAPERAAKRVRREAVPVPENIPMEEEPIVKQAKKTARAPANVKVSKTEVPGKLKATKAPKAKAKAEPTVVAILESAKEDQSVLSPDFYKRLEQTLAHPDTTAETVASISAAITKLLGKKTIPQSSPLFDLKKIMNHAKLLRSESFEKEPMSEKEALHLAVGLKNEIAKVEQASKKGLEAASELYLQKSKTGFARDVHMIGRTAHVISAKELGSGTYKVASRANSIALDTIQKSVKLGINLQMKKIVPDRAQIKDREKVVKEAVAEMSYQMKLQGPGIGPLWGVTVFEENLGEGASAPQISIMAEPAVPLEDLDIPEDDEERLEQNITLADQVLVGLERCHAAGVVHLDLKHANVNTYLDDKTGLLTAGLADFGYASEPAKGASGINSTIGLGSSGTCYYTPPELYFNSNYLEERAGTLTTDVPKVDMYAFGCMLYERHFAKPDEDGDMENAQPPGYEFIDKTEDAYWKTNPETGTGKYVFPEGEKDKIVADVRQQLAEEIQEKIEKPYAKLAKKKKLNETEKFEMFIYSLMRLKPEDRLSAADARKQFDAAFSERAA